MKALMIASLLMFSHIVLAPGARAADRAPQALRDLIVLAVEKNIGLQIKQVDIPLSDAEISLEDAAFDPELYSSLTFSETSIPYVSTFSFADTDDRRLITGQLGLRKRFSLGTSADLAVTTERTTGNDFFNDFSPTYRTVFLLDLTQPLLRGYGHDVNTTSLNLARNQRRQAVLGYLFQAQSLALQVEVLTRQLAGEMEIAYLQQQAVDLAEDLYAANKSRFAAGVIPISEVQEAETALADRELNRSLAMQSRDLLREDLNRQFDHFLSDTFAPELLLADRPVPAAQDLPEFEQMFSEARLKRVDLKISEFDQRNSSLQKRFYGNQLKPQLDLKLQVGLHGLSGEERSFITTTSRFSGPWLDSFPSAALADGYQWSAGLEFSLPLDNRVAKARYRQAGLEQKLAGYRTRDFESALRTELQQQRATLLRTGEQLKIAERFETLAELSLRQEQRRLEEGLSDTFRIISFQDKMIDAKIGRIKALVQYQQAAAQMNFARGIILQQQGIEVKLDAEEHTLEIL